MAEEKKRKITLPQLDELWNTAKAKWGDPGLRHPPPDSRFESLRHLLNQIESLFDSEKDEDLFDGLSIGTSVSAKKRKIHKKSTSRRLFSNEDPDDDMDEDEEIPF